MNNYAGIKPRKAFLTPEEEREIITQVKNGNEKAKKTFIESYFCFVVRLAKDYKNFMPQPLFSC